MSARGVNPILWTEEGGVANFNILPLILQTSYDLNLVMFDIIKFLTPVHEVLMQPLSLYTTSARKKI